MTELLRQAARDQESTLEWESVLNCTLANSTAQFHGGSKSVEITATTAAQVAFQLVTPWASVSAGTTYTASMWLRFEASGRLPDLYLLYSNSGNNFLGSFTVQATPAINTWTEVTVPGLAPATADGGRLFVSLFGMGAGEKLWLDDASFTSPGSPGLGVGQHVTMHSP